MLLEGNSDLIQSVEVTQLKGQHHEILHFVDGKALVIGHDSIALFKNKTLIGDPLGNGLISMAAIPANGSFKLGPPPWVTGHQAGFVGLSNQGALLILPIAVRLYRNKSDALKNTDILLELPLQ